MVFNVFIVWQVYYSSQLLEPDTYVIVTWF